MSDTAYYFIDTHAHQYSEELAMDISEAMLRCDTQHVRYCLLPNIDQTSIAPMLALEKTYPNVCKSMMGLHPCYVKADFKEQLEIVYQHLQQRDFIAIGEIGLDLYWDKSFFESQKEAFQIQMDWAVKLNLPVSIHCRNAHDELMQLLREMPTLPKGIYHCFSGNLEQAKEALSFGQFKLGIGGVVTFKNAGLDKVVAALDLSDIVLETDAPYLAPLPYRGKRNESSYIHLVAEKIAEIKQVPIETVAQITSANAEQIFHISK
jgi:TatD DNase family protein